MGKKRKLHFSTGLLEAGSDDYRPCACGYWHPKDITTTVKKRVTCLVCLKWLARRHHA